MFYTFYSFKGGVGRSMALANIAECFYLKGLKVIVIDWDLEAPGLESFFFERATRGPAGRDAPLEGVGLVQSRLGLIDLLTEYKRSYSLLAPAVLSPVEEWAPKSFRERMVRELQAGVAQLPSYAQQLDAHLSLATYLFPIHEQGADGSGLWLLPAGWRQGDRFEAYAEAVQSFDWENFYTSYRGKEFFDWMRTKLLTIADVVLIDSRTGVTEMSGVCARQLADVVVAFCAPNGQNVDGVAKMVRSFKRPETIEARNNRPLETLVIPTRVDPQEVLKLEEFLERFVDVVDEAEQAPKVFGEVGTRYWDLRIPYRTVYSYEERRVIGRGIKDLDPTRGLETAYRRIAAHLALLAEEGGVIRSCFSDELQDAFPALLPKVALLCEPGADARATELRRMLEDAKIRVWPDVSANDLSQWTSVTTHALHVVIVAGDNPDLTAMRAHVRVARQSGTWIHIVGPSPQWEAPRWLRGAAVYPAAGKELRENLSGRREALRAPMMTPAVPQHFVERPELQQRLKALLLSGTGAQARETFALWGPAGFGKSTLAAAVARDDEVVDAFPDGILWVTDTDPRAITRLHEALTGDPANEPVSASRVAGLLRGRRVLLVIEDAWNLADVTAKLDLADRGTTLVLTRNLDIAAAVSPQVVTVGEMTPDEATRLLTGTDQGSDLAARLTHWPLPLALARAGLDQQLARHKTLPDALEDLDEKLRRHGVLAFDAIGATETTEAITEDRRAKDTRRPGSPGHDVKESDRTASAESRNRSVAVSVEATLMQLAAWQQRRLDQLVQLCRGLPITFAALDEDWGKRPPEQGEPRRFGSRERQKLLQALSAVSLIEWKAKEQVIQLAPAYRLVLEAQGKIGDAVPRIVKRHVSSAIDRQSNPDVDQVKRVLGGQEIAYEDALALFGRLKSARYFGYARQLMARIRRMPLASERRLWTAQQLALCTYKDTDLGSDERSRVALAVLDEADPLSKTVDQETLGLAGAIFKYRFKASGQISHVERSAAYYLRGYEQGIDKDWGYTAINAAFVLDLLALHEDREAKIAGTTSVTAAGRRALAKRIRTEIADGLLKLAEAPDNEWLSGQWWFLVTVAEALFGLDRHEEARFWLREAMSLEVAEWEFETTARQLAELAWAQNDGEALPANSPASLSLQLFLGNDTAAVESVTTGRIGLALSGGGFRASLFHIGVLARLAELDLLRRVETISCVSGGSIVGAHYYLAVRKLQQEKADEAITRDDYIAIVRRLERDFGAAVQKNLRTRLYANPWVSLKCLIFPRYNRTNRLGELFESEIFSSVERRGHWPLHDLTIAPCDAFEGFTPKLDNWRRTNKVPMLVLNATTLNTGHNWQFTATWMGEPPAGAGAEVDTNDLLRRMYYWEAPHRHRSQPLGRAVAASACVPGLFDPVVLDRLFPGREVRLVDGGVHDNQGIAALIDQECSVMLISDASGQMESQRRPSGNRFQSLLRSSSISMARVREMGFRDAESRFRASQIRGLLFLHLKQGLESTPIDWVGCIDPFELSADAKPVESRGPLTGYGIPKTLQARLAGLRTDLDSFSDVEADALMYSGYRMASVRLAESLPGMSLPTAAVPADWRFLGIERAATKSNDFEEAHDDLSRVLATGRANAGKLWRLGGPHWLLVGLLALVVAANLAIGEAGDLLGSVLVAASTAFWWTFLYTYFVLVVATGIWLIGLVFSVAGWHRPWTKTVTAVVMTTVGWIPWALHQHVFDPLFLWRGSRQSESTWRTIPGLWKPMVAAVLLLVLAAEPFVTRARQRSAARSEAFELLRTGAWQDAAVAFGRVIDVDSKDVNSRIGRAWANRTLKQYPQAIADYDVGYESLGCSRFGNNRATRPAAPPSPQDPLVLCDQLLRDRAYTHRLAGQEERAAADEKERVSYGLTAPSTR